MPEKELTEKKQINMFKENENDFKDYFGFCSHKWVYIKTIESRSGEAEIKICRCYKCGKWRTFRVW